MNLLKIVHIIPKYNMELLTLVVSFQDVLEQLFKLFDQDRDQCLQQEDWIEFLKQRLT